MEKANLPYNAITLEVTESIATNKYTWHVLSILRSKGVKIALDDFCTGYSSLSTQLNIRVIAEGIEQSVQLKMLQQYGDHNIQSYYYSPAKPIKDCLNMLHGSTGKNIKQCAATQAS